MTTYRGQRSSSVNGAAVDRERPIGNIQQPAARAEVPLRSFGASQRLPGRLRRGGLTSIGFFIISCWIASFTVSLDIVYEFKLYDILSVIGVIFFSRELVLGLKSNRSPFFITKLLLLIFAFGTLVSVVRSLETGSLGIGEVDVLAIRAYRVFSFIAIFIIILKLNLRVRDLTNLLRVIYVSVLAQSVIIALQSIDLIPILWPVHERFYLRIVPTGTLGLNHLNSVVFMVVGLSAIVSLLELKRRWTISLILWHSGSTVLFVYAMLLGEARSSIVALAVLAILWMRRRRAVILLVGVMIFGVILTGSQYLDVGYQFGFVWSDRTVKKMAVESVGEISTLTDIDRGRPMIWTEAAKKLVTRPDIILFGAGFQNFIGFGIRASAGHNLFLHVFVELGILGIIFYFAFLWRLWSIFRRSGKSWYDVSTGSKLSSAAESCLLTIILIGLFNESLYPQRAMMGFMGFCLTYFAIAGHTTWISYVAPIRRRRIYFGKRKARWRT
jgi:hypothetical protein